MAWQVGDKALCVALLGTIEGVTWLPEIGRIYTVAGFDHEFVNEDGCMLGIELEEDPEAFDPEAGGWHAGNFRKVVRDKHEACEPEFVTLLKRNRVSA